MTPLSSGNSRRASEASVGRKKKVKEIASDSLVLSSDDGSIGDWIPDRKAVENFLSNAPSDDGGKKKVSSAMKKLKIRVRGGSPLFGVPLETLFKSQPFAIPSIVIVCVRYLLSHSLKVEGIFRVSGNASSVDALAAAFDADPSSVTVVSFLILLIS